MRSTRAGCKQFPESKRVGRENVCRNRLPCRPADSVQCDWTVWTHNPRLSTEALMLTRAATSLLIGTLFLPAALRADDKQEIERLRQEILRLRETLLERERKALDLLKQVDELRKQKVSAEITEKTLRARNEDLLEKFRALEKRLGDPVLAPPVGRGKEFPPEAIEGLVTKVDKSGLMVLSIGADAGLKKGQVLHVFRLDAKPEKSVYLGIVEILDVRPT